MVHACKFDNAVLRQLLYQMGYLRFFWYGQLSLLIFIEIVTASLLCTGNYQVVYAYVIR